jgi:hypothetical protein
VKQCDWGTKDLGWKRLQEFIPKQVVGAIVAAEREQKSGFVQVNLLQSLQRQEIETMGKLESCYAKKGQ